MKKVININLLLLFQFVILFFSSFAFAQSPQITYHGRIIDGTTNLPVTAAAVTFRLQIRTPGAENCLLYEEQQVKNLSTTDGIFVIGINNGSGTRLDSSGYSIEQIFSNKQSFSFAGGACSVGTTYTPGFSDARRLLVNFNDGSFAGWEPLPSQTLAYTPMAVESLNIGGFPAASLLRFVDGFGNPFNTSPLSNAQYTQLTSLIAGTSPLYVQAGGIAGGFSGALAGDVTGTQGATVVARLNGTPIVNTVPTAGQYLIFNGTQWAPAAGSGGTVQNVSSGNAYIGVTSPTLNPVITINVGTVANTVAAGDDPRIVGAFQTATALGGDLSGNLPNPTVATVGGRTAAQINTSVGDTIAATDIVATPSVLVKRDASGNSAFTGVQATNFSGRNHYFFDGTNTNSINIRAPAAAIGSNLTWTLPNSNGTAGYVLGTDGAGNLAWQSPTTGSVTTVTASSPLASTGGFSPNITIQVANGTQDGYLATADWTTFNNKLSTGLNNGLVWVGNAGNVATPRFLNITDVKSSVAGDWFAGAACPTGQMLTYSAVSDQITCAAYSISSGQVTAALGYTPVDRALPSGEIYVGSAGNVAAGVAMSGDATIANTGAVTIANNAVTTAKINNLAVTDAKINDVAWGKITSTPTTIAGYGIVDAVLLNAGGVSELSANTFALRPAAGTSGRVFVSTDTQEIFRDNGVAWVRVGSNSGLGGTVTSVTGTLPISVATGTTTPVVSMTQANTTTDGWVSSTDWNTFNNKLTSTLNNTQIFVGNAGNVATGVAMSGDATIANTGAVTIANNAVTTAKINNLAVTDAKINDVAWGKITATPTTVAGYGITDGVRNVGVGAGNVVTSLQAGNTAGRPAAGTDGRIYVDTQAQIIYRDNGAAWINVGSANGTGGTVTSITAGAGLTGGTITGTGTIGLGTELAGVNALATTGVVKRTGAGTYGASAVDLTTADVTGTLPVGSGGTGATTLTSGSLVVGNGAGAVNTLAGGSAGNLVYATGASTWASGTPDTAGVVDKSSAQTISGAKTFSAPVIHGPTGVAAGNGGEARFMELAAGGANYVGFKAPDALAGNVVWTLPIADGTPNQVLKTDGFGVLSWTSAAVGTVTNVSSANADIGVATGTTTPVLTLNSGTGASQIVKLNASAELPAVSGTNLTNLNASNISSGTLAVGQGGTGVNTIGAGNIVIGNGAGAVNSLAGGSSGNVVYATGVSTWASGTPDTAGLVDKSSVQAISGAKTFGATVKMSNQNLFQLGDAGANAISMRAPGAVTSYTMTWPAAVGGAGQHLQTDALGNLSWVTPNPGTVTNVTGTAPVQVATGTSTPVISMTQSNTTTDGYLSSTDWNTFNNKLSTSGGAMTGAIAMGSNNITATGNILMSPNKSLQISQLTNAQETILVGTLVAADNGRTWYNTQSNVIKYWDGSAVQVLGVAGAGITSINGLTGPAQTLAVGTAGTDFTISPAGSTNTFNLPSASAVNRGALTSADWTTFNSKLTSVLNNGQIFVGSAGNVATGVAMSGDATIANTGAVTLANTAVGAGSYGSASAVPSFTVDSKGRLTAAGSSAYQDATGAAKGIVQIGSNINVAAGTISLNAASITGALTYTPLNEVLTSGQIFVGSAGNVATGVAMSGDATIANSGAVTIANNAVTTAKINNLAVTDAKINDVAWGKITSTPTTVSGYGITDGVRNVGAGAGNVVTTFQSGNTAGRPAAGTDGRIYIDTQAQIIYRDNGAAWINVGSANGTGGTVTSITAGAGLTGGTITGTGTIGLGTELAGVNGLATTGFVKRTGAGTYTAGAVDISTGDVTGTLPVGNGGTGATSIGAGNIVIGGGAAAVTSLAGGSAGNVVYATGASTWASGTPDTAGLVDKSSVQAISGAKTFGATVKMSNQNLFQLGDAGANAISMRAPGAVTSYTMTWPAAVGGAGQHLQTDASGNLSWVTPSVGTVTNVTGTAPVQVATGTSTPVISMTQSNTTTDGYISSTDWNTFNNKLTSTLNSAQIFVGSAGNVATGVAMSGDATIANNGAVTIANNAVTTAKINNLAVTDAKINDVAWGKITSTPTTVAGYGITDGVRNVGAGAGNVVTTFQSGNTAGRPAAGTDGRIYIDTQAQIIYRDNGAAWINVGSAVGSGGTVTNVTSANADIGVATGTSTPVLTLNSGTGNNQIVKLDGSARLPAVDGSQLTNLDATSITAGTLPVGRGGTGATTITSGSLVVGNGAGAVNSLAGGSAGNVVYATGASTWASGTPDTAGLVDKTSVQTVTGAKTFSSAVVLGPTGVAAGNGGETRFMELAAGGANYVGFKAPDALAGNVVWTLPIADGTPNQVLQTNGSGVLSWASPGSGTVTSITAGAGLTGGTITGAGTIGLGTELAGVNGLATTGFVKRTGAGTYTASAVDISTGDVTGTLPVGNGGTGATSIGAGNIVIGGGAAAVTSLASGSSGNVVYGTGVATWASGTPDTAGLVDKSSVQAISGAKTFGATVKMSNQNLFQLGDAGANAISMRAPGAVTSYTMTWPAAVGGAGQHLQTDASGNLSWVTPSVGTVTSVSGTAPVQVATGTTTPVISMTQSNTTTDGYISSTDWNTFNNKLTSTLNSAQIFVGSAGNVATGVAMSGDATIANNGAVTIANNAVTTAKINNLAVTDAKINDVAWGKITSTPTTVAGYGITDGVRNVGAGAGNVVTTFQSGNTAGRPAAGTDGRMYVDTQGKSIFRDNGTTWDMVGGPGTVTSITAGAGLTGGTITGTGTIGLDTELAGLNGLATTGFVKRTGAGTYTAGAVDISTGDVTGTLPVGNGGTGATTLTSGSLIVGNGAGAVNSLAGGTAGNLVYATGASTWASGSADTAGVVDKTSAQTVTGAKTFSSAVILGPTGVAAGNGGETRFMELAAGGANYVGFKAPDALAGNVVWTLPIADGTPNQVLQTNGSGVLSWAAPGSGTVTSVTSANADIGVATTTTTPVLTLNSGTGNNQIVKLDGSARLPAVDGSQLTNLDATSITAGTLPVGRGGTGATSIGSGNIVIGAGTGALTSLASGSSGNVVYGTGVATWASGSPDTAGLVDKSSVQSISGAKTFGATVKMSNQNLFQFGDTGANSISMRAPAAVTASYTLTWPAAAGSANNILSTDASGNLSWVANLIGTSVTSGSLMVGNGTGTVNTLAAGSTGNVVYATGVSTWASGTPTAAGLVAQGTNSFGAAMNVGTGDANTLNLKTNGTTRVALDTSGGVQVSGQAWSAVQTSAAATPLTWDTNTGNTMRWTLNTSTITTNIHNMKPGASYMLVVSGTGTGTNTINCYSDAGVTALPTGFVPANGNRVTGSLNKTIYTLMSDGQNCLITWITGY